MAALELSNLSSPQQAETHVVQLDERGRIVLPLAIRNRLSLSPKEKLIATVDGATLQLVAIKRQVARARGMLADISPERCLSEELISERRKEASLE